MGHPAFCKKQAEKNRVILYSKREETRLPLLFLNYNDLGFLHSVFFSKSRVPDFQKAGCPIVKKSGCRLTGRLCQFVFLALCKRLVKGCPNFRKNPICKSQKDLHSQVDIFCHFKFYHNRKNFHTATTFFADTEKLVFIPPFLQMCIYDRVSQQTLYFCSLPYWPPCEQLFLGFRITGTYGNVGTPFYCFVPD